MCFRYALLLQLAPRLPSEGPSSTVLAGCWKHNSACVDPRVSRRILALRLGARNTRGAHRCLQPAARDITQPHASSSVHHISVIIISNAAQAGLLLFIVSGLLLLLLFLLRKQEMIDNGSYYNCYILKALGITSRASNNNNKLLIFTIHCSTHCSPTHAILP